MIRLLLFLLLFSCIAPLSAQLNGTYTIGGTNPAYPDFAAAASALATQGISGNVTFNVRPGTYTGQVEINQIPGSNVNRTVTFQAENGDSSSVLLLNTTAINTTNYLLALQNVGQVVLKSLSFKTPESGAYSNAITLYNATNIRLENCLMTGSLNTSTQNTNARVSVIVAGICPNLMVRNCFFRNGYNAIGVFGGETQVIPDLLIEKNRFYGTISFTVQATYAPNIKVRQNLVDSCALGFSIRFCSTAVVQHNRIYTTTSGCLYLYECVGTATNRGLVSNNMMSTSGSTTQVNGALIQSCRYLDFFNNSLNIQSGTDQCYGVFLANSSRYIRLQNNSVVVKSGGSPVVVQNEPNEVETFSHCNLYNGLILNDLPPNSISVNPYYVSGTDLHVTNAVLNNLGTPLPTVTTDIDGESRNALTPDIGADEYTSIQLSAGVVGFVNPSADSIYCGDLPLTIVFQNTGLEVLTSALITYSINGVQQQPLSWNGSLSSGQYTQVALGSPALIPLQGNTISVQCSAPNGSSDAFIPDNQLIFNDLFSGMAGTYTIGGANPDFPNFSTAVNALKKGGLCGSTTLLVRDGTYNEQIEIFSAVKGSSPQNWLTFLGESGDSSAAVLSAAATVNNAFTLRLQNCRFMKFKSMKVKQTANSNNYSPVFVAFGSDITFENCMIEGYSSSSSSSNSVAALAAFPDSNLTVRNCLISGGAMGASLIGTGPLKYNLIFENNLVYSAGDDCMNLQKWANVRVKGNLFSAGSFNSLYGIYGLNLYNYDISSNQVLISGVQATVGIYLINCAEYNDDISLVANNSISMNLGTDIIAVSRGMWIINCDSIHIIHNTVRHNSADLDNYAFQIQQSKGAYVVNNVFANTGLGFAFNAGGVDYSTFDYNVYYTGGTILANGSADLSGVQALTGGDQHSIVANPMWTSYLPDSLALHNPILENIGTETEVLVDISGFPRQFPNPDPGAFETPSAPVVQLGPDLNACGQVTLNGFAPGASAYLWNTGATTSGITVTASGTFILTASNEIGTSTDTILVNILPLPSVDAGSDISICMGDTLEISGSGSGDCQWSELSGNAVSSNCNFSLTVSESIAYILTTTDENSCQASDTLLIQANPIPAKPVIAWNGSVLSVVSGDQLQWWLDGAPIADATDNSYLPVETGNYVVQVTNASGCSVLSEAYFYMVSSTVEPKEYSVTIFPNPASGTKLFVQVTGRFNPDHFDLMDAQGRLLQSGPVVSENTEIYAMQLPSVKGLYFLKIWDANGVLIIKKVELL